MNPNEYLDLDQKIKALDEKMDGITSLLNRYRISMDQQKKTESITTPGIGCKLAFDAAGHIIRTFELEPKDIPMLPFSKVDGLDDLRESINNQVKKLKEQLNTQQSNQKPVIAGTGCKVNYDSRGRVLSSSGLLVDDIPTLPMSKIEGLQELMQVHHDSAIVTSVDDKSPVVPHTACKVTYDKDGRIVRSEELTVNDLPREVIDRLNKVESQVLKSASTKSMNVISEMVIKKIDANEPITPGTYSKVMVDSNGLVRQGSALSAEDLPDIGVNDIVGLREALRGKVDHKVYLELSATVNTMAGSIAKINEVAQLKEKFDSKVDHEEFERLNTLVIRLKDQVSSIIHATPNDTIQDQIDIFTEQLSTLGGRISTIESILKIQ